jgi:ribosomal-protein-alanine N-acetyltransferase
MTLVPLLIDEDQTKPIYANPDCEELFKSYPDYYYKVGYNPPWIGYLIMQDDKVVGAGGFTGKPQDGKVEIAYWTFKNYEGQGIASFVCKHLVEIAKVTDPHVIVTAKTAPDQNASTTVLQRNGFVFKGVVQDHEIGDAWEWEYEEPGIQ